MRASRTKRKITRQDGKEEIKAVQPHASLTHALREQDESGAFSYLSTLELIYPTQQRVVAIGDIHGDMEYGLICLRLAKVIDEKNKWIGGNTWIIQTGDQLDRYRPKSDRDEKQAEKVESSGSRPTTERDEDDMAILDLFDDLGRQAEKAGGKILSLLGNHEAANIAGDWRYVSREGLKRWGYRIRGRQAAFAPGGPEAIRLARTRPVFVIVGRTLFAHAGFSGDSLKKAGVRSREDLINVDADIRLWMLGLKSELKTSSNGHLPDLVQFATTQRALGEIDEHEPLSGAKCTRVMGAMLRTLKIDRVVVGHTIQERGISSACTGATIRIDVGGSYSFRPWIKESRPQVLEINDDCTFRILSACIETSASRSTKPSAFAVCSSALGPTPLSCPLSSPRSVSQRARSTRKKSAT